MILLHLSSKGQLIEDMQRDMAKKQRIRSVIETDFKNKKTTLENNYDINYR